MTILDSPISSSDLSALASHIYGEMIKAVADIDRGVLALDAELHSDLERMLLEDGSDQDSLWGFNLYPDEDGEDFIEFDSLINIRPRQGNMSRDVENKDARNAICRVVDKYIQR